MRRLVVHCGPAKTGTSAIQACLRDTPMPGLLYPTTGQWPDGAHHKLGFAIDGRTRRGDIDIPPWDVLAPALVAELDAFVTGTVVISSEHLAAAKLPEFLDHLLPLLARPFDEIKAVVVLRHPLERAASAYNQAVKDAVVSESRLPDDYLDQSGNDFRLMPLIRNWLRSPFETQFLSYHPAATLVPRFLDQIGHGDHTIETAPKRRNASINGYGLMALLTAHRLELSPPDRARLFDDLRTDKVTTIWKGPSFPFSPEATQSFMNTVVRDDLLSVKSETGIDLTDLYQTPPERFLLTGKQRQALRRRLTAFDLTPTQAQQLNRLLAEFAIGRKS